MVKKLFIFMSLMVLSLALVNQTVHADAVLVSDPGVNTGGLWHVEEGNRIYVHMRYSSGGTFIETGNFPAGVSDSLLVNDPYATNPDDIDYSHYTYWPDYQESDLSFPNSVDLSTALLSNPNPEEYTVFKVEIISNMTSEYRSASGREEPSFEEVASYSIPISELEISVYNKSQMNYCVHEYSFLSLSIDGDDVLTNRQLSEGAAAYCSEQVPEYGPYAYPLPEANPNYEDLAFGVRMYWERETTSSETINPGIDVDPWSALPETTGSPTSPTGDWGVATNIEHSGQQVSFDINYLGVVQTVSEFTVDGSLDFIDKANDVLYYTDSVTEDRMLYFNFGETLDSAILAASSYSNVHNWRGEALWNLTQNEIKVTDQLNVYNYIPEADEYGNIYSYFYMPNVEIDELISVSSVLAYRYWDDGFLNIGDLESGEIQYKPVAAIKGEVNSYNPNWVETTYKSAYSSAAIGTVALSTVSLATSISVPVYGWAIPFVYFLTGVAFDIADSQEWFAYDVAQIEHYSPSVSLANEINTYIEDAGGQDLFDVDTDRLYRLHLATLNEYDEVQIIGDESNVTQIVWETDGEIHVVYEDNINDLYVGPGLEPPTQEIGNEDLEIIVYSIGAVVVVLLLAQMGLFKAIKRSPGIIIILLGILLYMAYQLEWLGWLPW